MPDPSDPPEGMCSELQERADALFKSIAEDVSNGDREVIEHCQMYCTRPIYEGETVYVAWDWICCAECWREVNT